MFALKSPVFLFHFFDEGFSFFIVFEIVCALVWWFVSSWSFPLLQLHLSILVDVCCIEPLTAVLWVSL